MIFNDPCSQCEGKGLIESIFGKISKCNQCGGLGKDPGVIHVTKGKISSGEFVDILIFLGQHQKKSQHKLTKLQVKYIRIMSGSDISAEIIGRDMSISPQTIENIWTGKSYYKY